MSEDVLLIEKDAGIAVPDPEPPEADERAVAGTQGDSWPPVDALAGDDSIAVVIVTGTGRRHSRPAWT